VGVRFVCVRCVCVCVVCVNDLSCGERTVA
jgi:hypothetical protein